MDKARIAAIWELEKRNECNDELERIKSSLENKLTSRRKIQHEHNSEFSPPPDLPRIIRDAVYMLYASVGIGFVELIFTAKFSKEIFTQHPTIVYQALFSLGVIGFLSYMIHLGKDWARITFLIIFLIGMLGFPFILVEKFMISPIVGVLTISTTLFQALALILLLTKKAGKWYKFQKSKSNENPT